MHTPPEGDLEIKVLAIPVFQQVIDRY